MYFSKNKNKTNFIKKKLSFGIQLNRGFIIHFLQLNIFLIKMVVNVASTPE